MDFSFISDRDFLRDMWRIAAPVAFQQLITAALTMIDVLMVSQLGETSIAAVGLANQIFFVFILIVFGTTSGMSIFTAQYWGKREIGPIRQVLGMCLLVVTSVGLLFSLGAILIPETLLSFYTNDPRVIAIGSDYLRIVGMIYPLTAISNAFITTLRSIERVRMAVVVTVIALILKTALGYTLIFGMFGFPELGVNGAAIATAVGWTFEAVAIVAAVYLLKTPLAAPPLEFFKFPRAFFFRVLKTATPALLNELVWSLGITSYNAVYARIGTNAIAAVNINASIEELAFVIYFGLSNACAVLVGKRIGAKLNDEAYQYGQRFFTLTVVSAWLIGTVIILLRVPISSLYHLTPKGSQNMQMLLLVFGLTLWLRAHNFVIFIGTLRAGGDTRFALVMELLSIWLIGVPLAVIGGFVLDLPVYGVYALVSIEELAKFFVIQWRFRSRRWIHDLVNITE